MINFDQYTLEKVCNYFYCNFLCIYFIIFFRKHKDDAPTTEDDVNDTEHKPSQEVPKWDSEFLKVDQGTLFGEFYFMI